MKKKLFSLLTLLLFAGTFAWADETLFSFTVSKTEQTANVTEDGDEPYGGTCLFYYEKDKGYFTAVTISNVSTPTYNFNGNNAYVKVSLKDGVKLSTNDKVVIEGVCNNANYASRGFTIATNNGNNNAVNTNYYASQSARVELTATLNANYNGLSEFYIKRNGGGNLISITVVRPNADATSPTCTTSQTSETASSGVALNLNVTAEHYTSLQWYKSDSELADGEAISGAVTSTYSYIATDSEIGSTFYFYCIATNDNAEGEKTATSSRIAVTVIASPIATQAFTNGDKTCTWSSLNINIAKGETKAGNGLYFDANANKIQMQDSRVQVVSGNIMYVEVPSPNSAGTVTLNNGSTTGRYLETISGEKLYIKATDGQPNSVDFTGADIVQIDGVNYLQLNSKSDCKFGGVTIALTGETGKTNVAGWASYTPLPAYNNTTYNATLSDGAKAYYVTAITNDKVTATPVTTLAAGKGYFVKGAASTGYTATFTEAAADGTEGTMLVGCLTSTVINDDTAGQNFILGHSGETAGLYEVDSDVTVAAGKAYLCNTTGAAAGRFLTLDLDETTGISAALVNGETENNDVYDLSGRKIVNGKSVNGKLQKGLYIVNGKKVVVR